MSGHIKLHGHARHLVHPHHLEEPVPNFQAKQYKKKMMQKCAVFSHPLMLVAEPLTHSYNLGSLQCAIRLRNFSCGAEWEQDGSDGVAAEITPAP